MPPKGSLEAARKRAERLAREKAAREARLAKVRARRPDHQEANARAEQARAGASTPRPGRPVPAESPRPEPWYHPAVTARASAALERTGSFGGAQALLRREAERRRLAEPRLEPLSESTLSDVVDLPSDGEVEIAAAKAMLGSLGILDVVEESARSVPRQKGVIESIKEDASSVRDYVVEDIDEGLEKFDRYVSSPVAGALAKGAVATSKQPLTAGPTNVQTSGIGDGGVAADILGSTVRTGLTAAIGFPAGMVRLALAPGSTWEMIEQSYVDAYGPILEGDWGKVLQYARQNGLVQYGLDAFTVASLGVGAAGRAGLVRSPRVRHINADGVSTQRYTSPNLLSRILEGGFNRWSEKHPDAPFVGARGRSKRAINLARTRREDRELATLVDFEAASKRLGKDPVKLAAFDILFRRWGDEIVTHEITMRQQAIESLRASRGRGARMQVARQEKDLEALLAAREMAKNPPADVLEAVRLAWGVSEETTATNVASGVVDAEVAERSGGARERFVTPYEDVSSPVRDQILERLVATLGPERGAAGIEPFDLSARVVGKWNDISASEAFDRMWAGVLDELPSLDSLQQIEPFQTPGSRLATNQRVSARVTEGLVSQKDLDSLTPRNQDRFGKVNGKKVKLYGNVTPKDWVKRVLAVIPDKATREGYARWYEEAYPIFEAVFGPEEAPAHMRAFAVSQANASPTFGLGAVLKVVDVLSEGRRPTAKEISTASEAIADAFSGEVVAKGVAAKLSDFIDSLAGQSLRTWTGGSERGGAPVAVDVHVLRDRGFVDKKMVGRLKEKFGEGEYILDSDGRAVGTRYELVRKWYEDLTRYLNRTRFDGRDDWIPAQAQALGWAAIQLLYGVEPETLGEAIRGNTHTVNLEVTRGISGIGDDLSLAETKLVSERVWPVIQEMVEDIGGSLRVTSDLRLGVSAYEATPNGSIHFRVLGSPAKKQALVDRLAAAFDQWEVWATRRSSSTGAKPTLVVASEAFADSGVALRFFSALRSQNKRKFVGFAPTVVDGVPAISIVMPGKAITKKTSAESHREHAAFVENAEREAGVSGVDYHVHNTDKIVGKGDGGGELEGVPGGGGGRTLGDPLAAKARDELERAVADVRAARGADGGDSGPGGVSLLEQRGGDWERLQQLDDFIAKNVARVASGIRAVAPTATRKSSRSTAPTRRRDSTRHDYHARTDVGGGVPVERRHQSSFGPVSREQALEADRQRAEALVYRLGKADGAPDSLRLLAEAMDERDAIQASINEANLNFQDGGAKGAVQFDETNRGSLYLSPGSADLSTALHEASHTLRRNLPDDMLGRLEEFYGVKEGAWTVEQEELFARHQEAYWREGKAPNAKLRAAFDTFAAELRETYKRLEQLEDSWREIPLEVVRMMDEMWDPNYRLGEGTPYSPDLASGRERRADVLTGLIARGLRRPKRAKRSGQILFEQARFERGPKPLLQAALAAKKTKVQLTDVADIARASEPLDGIYPGALKPGWKYFNPEGATIPRAIKEELGHDVALLPREMAEFLEADYGKMLENIFPSELTKLPPDMRAKVRQVPGWLVDNHRFGNMRLVGGSDFFRQVGWAFDSYNNMNRMLGIYLKLSYIPVNFTSNVALGLLKQGVWFPRNLLHASGVLGDLSLPALRALDAEVGTGGSIAVMGTGRGLLGDATSTVAHFMNATADRLPRRAAIIHELRKQKLADGRPVVLRPGHPENSGRILEYVRDPRYREGREQAGMEAENSMVRFRGIGETERAVISRAIYVYPWIKGATRYTLRLPWDHPLKATVITQLGLAGWDWIEEQLGEIASFLKTKTPLRVGPTRDVETVVDPSSLTPFSTAADVGKSLSLALTGKSPLPSTAKAASLFSPALAEIGSAAFSVNDYGFEDTDGLMSAAATLGNAGLGRFISDMVSPRGDTKFYEDESRARGAARFVVGGFVPRKLKTGPAQEAGLKELPTVSRWLKKMESGEYSKYDVMKKIVDREVRRRGGVSTEWGQSAVSYLGSLFPGGYDGSLAALNELRRDVGLDPVDPDVYRSAAEWVREAVKVVGE